METVNLKSPITFRVPIQERTAAFTTKTFRGERKHGGNIPDKSDRVLYIVHEILIESNTAPWLPLTDAFGGVQQVNVLWSNVLSTQAEKGTV